MIIDKQGHRYQLFIVIRKNELPPGKLKRLFRQIQLITGFRILGGPLQLDSSWTHAFNIQKMDGNDRIVE